MRLAQLHLIEYILSYFIETLSRIFQFDVTINSYRMIGITICSRSCFLASLFL